MKKTFYSIGLMTVIALAAGSCAKEENPSMEAAGTSIQMTLNAEMNPDTAKASIDRTNDTWKFAFTSGDVVKVTNGEVMSENTYYTFTRDGNEFTGTVTATTSYSTWYAYYPDNSISLTGQTGLIADVAGKYAASGSHKYVKAGTTSLTIDLIPQVAILKINNNKGHLNISAKTNTGKYVSGMVASPSSGAANFDVATSDTKVYLIDRNSITKAGEYYIAVPSGVALTFYDGDEIIKGKDGTTESFVLEAGKHYTLTVGTVYTKAPDGALSGLFSITATNKVRFSKGNLYYNGSNWNFETNQYEYRTYPGKTSYIDGVYPYNPETRTTTTPDGNFGLFGWSTDAEHNKWGMHTVKTVEDGYTDGDFVDWGKNAIANGGNTAGLWRSLTKDEWNYMLATRSGNRFAKGKVSGVCGLIIFPDGYTGTTSGNGISEVNGTSAAYPSTDVSDWTAMESAGCVFLPAGGCRLGTDVEDVNSYGWYWSSTPKDTNSSYCLLFNNHYLFPPGNTVSSSAARGCGFSVRLVSAAAIMF